MVLSTVESQAESSGSAFDKIVERRCYAPSVWHTTACNGPGNSRVLFASLYLSFCLLSLPSINTWISSLRISHCDSGSTSRPQTVVRVLSYTCTLVSWSDSDIPQLYKVQQPEWDIGKLYSVHPRWTKVPVFTILEGFSRYSARAVFT